MKKMEISLLALFFLLIFTGAGFSADKVIVSSYVGKVEYRISGGKWQTAKVDDQIIVNAEIRVLGKNDSADIVLPDGSSIHITGGTTKSISDIILQNKKTKSKLLTKKNNQLETTSSVAGVRGNIAGGVASPGLIVDSLAGSCDYRIGTDGWTNIVKGMILPEKSEIRVNGTNDTLELKTTDGTAIRLLGMTSLIVSNLLKTDDQGKKITILKLLVGKIYTKVNNSPNQDFRVEAQNIVTAAGGTKFGVTAGKTLSVLVTEGMLTIADPAEKSNTIVVQVGLTTGGTSVLEAALKDYGEVITKPSDMQVAPATNQ